MPYIEFKRSTQVVHVTGSLEMTGSDQEEYDAKYGDVDVILAGSSEQIRLLLNRLNAGYDGGVDEVTVPFVDAMRPARPVRALARGDWVEWFPDADTRHEGMFLQMDAHSADHAYVRITKETAMRVPLYQLQYVEDIPIEKRVVPADEPDHEFEQGDRVYWTRRGKEFHGRFDYMRTLNTAYVILPNGETEEVWIGDLRKALVPANAGGAA